MGFGSKHDGDKYELQICEGIVFVEQMAYIKEQRRCTNVDKMIKPMTVRGKVRLVLSEMSIWR